MSPSEAAKRELEQLASAGQLTPQNTVERARDPTNPLHAYFTWDDAKAADERRLDQARLLIRSVRVEVEYEDRLYEAPKYVHDPRTVAQGYIPTIALRDDHDSAVAAVRRELARALACVRRAESIAAAAGIHIDVDSIAVQLASMSAAKAGESSASDTDTFEASEEVTD